MTSCAQGFTPQDTFSNRHLPIGNNAASHPAMLQHSTFVGHRNDVQNGKVADQTLWCAAAAAAAAPGRGTVPSCLMPRA